MTWLLWLGGALGALIVILLALRVSGASLWAATVRAHFGELESGALGAQGRLPSPARYHAAELDGLPAPVKRYFRTVLTDGQPIIASATLELTGTINLSTTAEQWKPFSSRQRIITRRPGFLWDAQVAMFPGLPAHVEDSYIAGQGRLVAKLLGLFAVAQSEGAGEIARGEFMRFAAEAAWYPTALLPSQGVLWQAVDGASARATMVDGPISLNLLFRFDDAGLIATIHADSRGADMGQDGVMHMLPWDCAWSDYRRLGGMLLPMTGEVAWIRPEGRKSYFVGHVQSLRHEFLP